MFMDLSPYLKKSDHLTDLHTHTVFSDGKDTPEEMVIAAIGSGLKTIGFSDHSHTDFDETYCMKKGSETEYKDCINALKDKYKEKISILCGIERDFYSSSFDKKGYDYSIGSVHYIRTKDGVYIPVDESADILVEAVKRHFNGDMTAFCEAYFQTVSEVLEKTGADIIGHFDLIAKFNENKDLFDPFDENYKKSAFAAIDKLLKYKKPFEINFGAITRGYRTQPYPEAFIMEYIREKGGCFVFSSDSHSVEGLKQSHEVIS